MRSSPIAMLFLCTLAVAGGVRWQVQSGETVLDRRCLGARAGESLLELMAREKLAFEASDEGGVCKIQDVGCESSRCFCECGILGCKYWALFARKAGGPWTYASRGANAIHPSDYEALAWVWTQGNMRKTSDRPAEIQDPCRAP